VVSGTVPGLVDGTFEDTFLSALDMRLDGVSKGTRMRVINLARVRVCSSGHNEEKGCKRRVSMSEDQ